MDLGTDEKKNGSSIPSDFTEKCKCRTEVFSRVVGYYQPVQNWNLGKKEEFGERKEFNA